MDQSKEKEARTITLTVDSRLEDVFLVGLAVRSICSYTSLSVMEASQMEVCVVEAVNNAIKHSYHLKKGYDVDIIISLYPDQIEFKVCNSGEPMKSTAEARVNFDPKDVKELPEGGLGLYIINSIMDEVSYRCLDGRNVVRMCKWIKPRVSLPE